MDMEIGYMKRALELALMGSGFVNPEPLSGAVLVKHHKIIGENHHHQYNRSIPVALEALQQASESTQDSQLYLNIEPKLDFGTIFLEAIRTSGIHKVFIGMEDPHPNNQGKVIALLREAGIEVNVGLMSEACQELNEIYTHYMTYGTPFVFVKWAMTLDGKLATKTGDSKWISGDESLKFVHHLRQRVAAIMVGEGTVRIDDPLLTTRLEGVEISNPLRVILSKYGDIEDSAKVLKIDETTKTLIIASKLISLEREESLLKRGVQVIKLEEKQGKISFTDILKALGDLQIDSLYIEGGSSVLGSAFESGIVNKVYAAVAPKIVGGKAAITPVAGEGIERMKDAIVLKNVSHEIVGNDVIIKGYIDKGFNQ